MISIFGDGLAGCLVCGFLFGLGVVFCCLVACLVCFPHGRDLLFLLNCVRIVCNLERPSELSWRARHGRKKKNFEQGGGAIGRFSLRTDPFTSGACWIEKSR